MAKQSVMVIGVLLALCAGILLAPGAARGQDAMSVASEIERALAQGPRGAGMALNQWEMNKEVILEDAKACIRAGAALAGFCLRPEVLHRFDTKSFSSAAAECMESAAEKIGDDDLAARTELGEALVTTAQACLANGAGDVAGKLQDLALGHLEAAAASDSPAPQVLFKLGTLYGQIAKREPPKAEEWIGKAADVYERARKVAGDSAQLSLKVGQLRVQLADMREEELERNPRDRKLKRKIKDTWEEAVEAFQQGLEIDEKNKDLQSAYNETLWELERVTEGKCRLKPIMEDCATRYRKVQFKIPTSNLWNIKPASELEDEDDLFRAFKYNRKEGQAISILISQYRWDANYVNRETNDRVGGDNIGGLADRSEADVRSYFEDIKDRQPLRKMPLSRYIRKSEGYMVKGLTQDGDMFEWRTWFFKNSKTQKTYKLLVLADLGMLERNPYELATILQTFKTID